MSKYDEPIRDINPVDYLREFISTALILTIQEEKIINFIYDNYRGLPVEPPIKYGSKYRTCLRCGEVKPVGLFEGRKTICKECRRKEKNGQN